MKFIFKSYNDLSDIKSRVLVQAVTEEFFNKTKDSPYFERAKTDFDFRAGHGQICAISLRESPHMDTVILLGLGRETALDEQPERLAGRKLYKYLNMNKIKSASVVVNTKLSKDEMTHPVLIGKNELADVIPNILFGLSLSDYSFDKYFTEAIKNERKKSLEELEIICKNTKEVEAVVEKNEIIVENVFFCRNLVSEPSNVLYPESYGEICKDMKSLGVEVEILGEKEMAKLGMDSLLSVGQGSVHESKMVILKWNGAGKKNEKAPLAFVGKGITFDTGGISLKPSKDMHEMKGDMAGSAVVASLIRLLAMRRAKINVVGIMPLVENKPDGRATNPGDIVKSMSGQTIEVLNTDAEGRMILADALYYAATKFEPSMIIDLATLTGAISVALGEGHAGLFTNNDGLAKELDAAGSETGELVWRMPLSEVGGFYDRQINSDFADMQNTGKTRGGGSITAAQFLQRFINKHPKWAHLDIAATAWLGGEGFFTNKYASGYGVMLLNRLIEKNYED